MTIGGSTLIQDLQGIIGMTNIGNELKFHFDNNDCDKATKHWYHQVYGPEFECLRDKEINLLEIGVFKGDSLRAWVDFFPNANIYGIDIFQRIAIDDIDILEHERVKWMKLDSTHIASTGRMQREWPGVKFDIIIDDGLHTPEGNAQTFNAISPLLKKGGAYYVEDVWPFDVMTTKEWGHYYIKNRGDRYNMGKWQIFEKAIAGRKIERFDNRRLTGQPDSYIIKVQ